MENLKLWKCKRCTDAPCYLTTVPGDYEPYKCAWEEHGEANWQPCEDMKLVKVEQPESKLILDNGSPDYPGIVMTMVEMKEQITALEQRVKELESYKEDQ